MTESSNLSSQAYPSVVVAVFWNNNCENVHIQVFFKVTAELNLMKFSYCRHHISTSKILLEVIFLGGGSFHDLIETIVLASKLYIGWLACCSIMQFSHTGDKGPVAGVE